MSRYREIDLSRVKTYSAKTRPSKVHIAAEAVPFEPGLSFREFVNRLPSILKAEDIKHVALDVVQARARRKPVIVMIGGHVIKTGCAPIIADLVERGFVTLVASNGSAAIHDTELARFGHTSEDVAGQLTDGSFGMAEDTAELVNRAADRAVQRDEGFGEAVGVELIAEKPPFLDRALLALCYRAGIPYTLHVALGTDIVHQHPTACGASIGEASMRDFRIFTHEVSQLGDGGVVLNLGSAVIMPEVFLKALTVARNTGHNVTGFTTVNLDMIQHYRPNVNVVQRPVMAGGHGYSITGHHEIMIPLLAALILEMDVAPLEARGAEEGSGSSDRGR